MHGNGRIRRLNERAVMRYKVLEIVARYYTGELPRVAALKTIGELLRVNVVEAERILIAQDMPDM